MGRLNLTTSAEVAAHTRLDDLKALPGSEVTRLIDRAEAMIDRYGDYDVAKIGYAEDMRTAANLTVERLFLLSDPESLRRQVEGVVEFTAGSYTQRSGPLPAVISGEVVEILNHYRVITA